MMGLHILFHLEALLFTSFSFANWGTGRQAMYEQKCRLLQRKNRVILINNNMAHREIQCSFATSYKLRTYCANQQSNRFN